MFMTPNVDRLKRLNTEGSTIGDTIVFCPSCHFQHERHTVGRNECPECRTSPLHVSKVDAELLTLTCKIKDDIGLKA